MSKTEKSKTARGAKGSKMPYRSEIIQDGEGKCIVAFAGLGLMMDGMGYFEFVRTFAEKGCKRIFLRDRDSCWYQHGISDEIDTIPKLRVYLEKLTAGYEVYMVGCSAGGFAAMLFGHFLKAKRVVAFSPQTTITLAGKSQVKDSRYGYVHGIIGKKGRLYRDLLPHLSNWNGVTQYDIHVGTLRVDQRHAARLRKCKGVRVINQMCGAHHIARTLRSRGQLKDMLDKAFGI